MQTDHLLLGMSAAAIWSVVEKIGIAHDFDLAVTAFAGELGGPTVASLATVPAIAVMFIVFALGIGAKNIYDRAAKERQRQLEETIRRLLTK